tara:strand:+ start:111 stop:215 length:105 start_codon:yes stop_codon:yes gene_type:complete
MPIQIVADIQKKAIPSKFFVLAQNASARWGCRVL